jgi:hypothetical protein
VTSKMSPVSSFGEKLCVSKAGRIDKNLGFKESEADITSSMAASGGKEIESALTLRWVRALSRRDACSLTLT